MKNNRIAAIVCCRWEENYICEFLDWYQKLGITKIFILDNNDKDYEFPLKPIIQDYIDEGYVEYVDYLGVDYVQQNCYNDVYFAHKDEYDYFLIVDADEFVHLDDKYKTLNDFLNDPEFCDCDVIQFPWIFMIGNDLKYHYENKPLRERFNKKSKRIRNDHFESACIKSLFKSSEDIIRINFHFPFYKDDFNYVGKYSDGTIIENCNTLMYPYNGENIYTMTNYVEHYAYKSADEYIRKIIRGRAAKQDKQNFSERTPQELSKNYLRFLECNFADKNEYKKIRLYINDKLEEFFTKVKNNEINLR